MARVHWTVLRVLTLRECPNQQNFDFDSEEWGHFQRGSDKSSGLACSLFVVVVVLFFLEFSINETQTANVVGCNNNTVAFQDVLV